MKKLALLTGLFTTVLAMGLVTAASAQTGTGPAQAPASAAALPANGTALQRPTELLQLKENIHNFGKIPQGRPAIYIFEIVNTGSTPLRLDNVHASCGCTTPEWSRDPIQPGATARIKVGYNAMGEGTFTKTVTIVYNTNQTKLLTITGEVYKVPQTSAPENASVQLLKQVN
ncbi:MAG TPA: DUF1573 domain-containing protein [Puia sp.]|jgi:hypothetical protein|nr:DUF1573 domain-containing protein [Puia sp.]